MKTFVIIFFLFLVSTGRIMADSAIVWSGQQDIKMGPGATPDWLPSLGWLLLDMNGDGSTDLRFDYVMDFTVQTQSGSAVTVIPQPPYSILDAAPIVAGSVVASGSTWGSGAYPLVDWESIPGVGLMGAGSWAFISNGYMGVSFTAVDGVHYGWVQVSSYNTMGAHINSWAYESQPGVGIAAGVVPEPSTIALFIIGLSILLAGQLRQLIKGTIVRIFGGRCNNIFPDDVSNNV